MEAIAATAVCHQRNAIFGARRVYLCFDAFPGREAELTASSAVQNITERDRGK
jgi:hypothetical protein